MGRTKNLITWYLHSMNLVWQRGSNIFCNRKNLLSECIKFFHKQKYPCKNTWFNDGKKLVTRIWRDNASQHEKIFWYQLAPKDETFTLFGLLHYQHKHNKQGILLHICFSQDAIYFEISRKNLCLLCNVPGHNHWNREAR